MQFKENSGKNYLYCSQNGEHRQNSDIFFRYIWLESRSHYLMPAKLLSRQNYCPGATSPALLILCEAVALDYFLCPAYPSGAASLMKFSRPT
ncbi:MAG: hypothetical protein E7L01_13365 [Paenibacillus macerans]|uniref:Uncharacterized protein n=1 Tax=Paenibacillus macerans TaxID=44252 RepID=A0A6N8EZ80_PAEMA|nr:hypothetical protein [Paenibacillus macerans]MDU5947945.1 hypothetical protein [Paenibacillus macerans]MDU7474305.1 hypothetical protein [Paenibacillus macerans]MEC0139600.1 hypothetical protein [Paenibacillus macerans]MUG24083.1 hypothetical protein [Paenibacillus macerans]UMV45462.1 hypothetical protein LMZ02_18245 [Paenibacillus macerans]